MHEFDPNGSLREYRQKRQRQETVRGLLFGGVVGAILITGAWLFIRYWR